MITTVRGVSASLPVSGFTALISNRFCPLRRSTWIAQVPSDWAVVRYGCSWPGVRIEIVAPAVDVPASRYDVFDSSTSITAWAGFVTARSGGRE